METGEDWMKVHGDYRANGYALIEGLIPVDVIETFLATMERDLGHANLSYEKFARTEPLTRLSTVEIPGHAYTPMKAFQWGLTPMVSQLAGRELLPSYDYFRIYQAGDICRLHSDRPSCEHSVSLTLAYSDGIPWPLEIGAERLEGPDLLREEFGGEAHASLPMNPGDAVIYEGVRHRHGRTTPNPNRWSAHLFLHFVDRDGPYKSHAFDAERIAAASRGKARAPA